MWQASFGQRKIISGFMKDRSLGENPNPNPNPNPSPNPNPNPSPNPNPNPNRSLGEKRLASMPDRVTNTVTL